MQNHFLFCTQISGGKEKVNILSGNPDSLLKVRLFKFKNDISYRIAHLLYHELIPIISPFVIKSLIVHDRK